MNTLTIILGMATATFAVRYPPLAAVGRIRLPNWAQRALEFVPVAVLSAIIVPAVIYPAGHADINLQNPYLVGGILAALIAWRTKNLLWTIILGMLIFLLWKLIVVPQFLV